MQNSFYVPKDGINLREYVYGVKEKGELEMSKRNQHRYYMGRIIKAGQLDIQNIIDAIMEPSTITKREYGYTFIDMYYDEKQEYLFGKLAKFKPDGEVEAIEPHKHKEVTIAIPDIKSSISPFVVDLKYMGIAYPQVWNNLKKDQFEKYFCELIEEKYDRLLVECTIEPIVDLQTFVSRVSEMDSIDLIKATVVPPNPLFGPVWKELKEYMENRDSSEFAIREKAKSPSGIKTKIIKLMKRYFEEENIQIDNHNIEYGISDQAVLMTADGYGHASLEGKKNGEEIIIKTKDNQKSFLYYKEPNREEFALKVREVLENINEERYLQH